MSDNIKVVVKIRPLISREIEDKLSYQWRVKNDTLYQLDQSGKEFGSCFTFDKVYDKQTKTSDVYKDVAKPIVEATTAGFNGTIFAYGQTSSGKTYTMTGVDDSPGIIPLAVTNLFEIIKSIPNRDFLVRVSYLEIYNETVKDLLNIEKKNIKVHDTLNGVKVDVTEMVTTSPEEVFKYLKVGEANRQTGATNMNEESSRSHSIFQIIIESREHIEGDEEAAGCVNVSQLNLVDLAGSERAGQTGATGLRFKEGTHINKSLSSLALVIKQLSEDPNKYVNYRDSKLTRILQNSLGGNAKTSIICAITPAAVEETISTLQFANRAKAIKNKPEVNAVATDATMIQGLTKQLSKLQAQLEFKKNVEQDNQQLHHKIAALQRLILNGFGQRSSAEIIGPRRKNVQPRRVTISTLHSIDEDHVTPAPKFCTPILKYNPMSFPSTSDFVPIQNASKLETLPEEVTIVTPPPRGNNINLDDEIIDLVSSKTPPCVLRKNAKVAEENLKEIEELTKREKIYEPRVNELIERLDENTTVIAKLHDDINTLTIQSKEKDMQIEQLKVKIGKSEDEIKLVTSAKLVMEGKLVDLEVLYETHKQNAKRREEELLSLLEDKPKKNEDIGKMASTIFDKELSTFMDMSKDVSLVNSDDESSITNDDESSSQTHVLKKEMLTQLTSKVERIHELETNLCAQNEKIESLEQSCRQLETLKASLSQSEQENSLLKATIETLNSTINNQKVNLESARSDLDSYNNMILELQNKLKDQETDVNVSDSILEKIIANEENFIANNDNMKNILQSFKNALNSRNEEIDLLKSHQSDYVEAVGINKELKEQLKSMNTQIDLLKEEAQKYNVQINEKDNLIEKLELEKNHWIEIQHQLAEKLTDVVEKNNELKNQYSESMNLVESSNTTNEQLTLCISENEARYKKLETINKQLNGETEMLSNKINTLEDAIKCKDSLLIGLEEEKIKSQEHLKVIEHQLHEKLNEVIEKRNLEKQYLETTNLLMTLKMSNEQLTLNACEMNVKHQELVTLNEELNNQIFFLSSKIVSLQDDNMSKDSLIIALKKEENLSEQHLTKAKSSLSKLQNILMKLSGNVQELPETIDNFVVIFNTLNDGLFILENKLAELISQKEDDNKIINNFQNELSILNEKHIQEIDLLQSEIQALVRNEDELSLQKDTLNRKLSKVTQELETSNRTLITVNELHKNLQMKLDEITDRYTTLQNDVSSKNILITPLQKSAYELRLEISNLRKEYQELHGIFNNDINNVMKFVRNTHVLCGELISDKETNELEVSIATKNNSQILKTILEKVIDLGTHFNIENNKSWCTEADCGNIHEQITYILDLIANSARPLHYDNSDKNVSQAILEITPLLDQNTECGKCLCLETKHKDLLDHLEIIITEKNTFRKDLIDSNTILASLQDELKSKAIEMDVMEAKILRRQKLDISMKQLVEQLQLENLQVKSRCSELEAMSNNRDIYHKEYNPACTGRQSICNLIETPQHRSPPSLLSICCENIINYIRPEENSISQSSSNASVVNVYKDTECSNCKILLSKLTTALNSNLEFKDSIIQLENVNRQLIFEQEEIRKEVALLLEPAYELQKKVTSHRTNLSTLTATTYAENKLLKSQVKALQHHHSRCHIVCQRDIPAVKQQLGELMSILKNDSSCFRTRNTNFERFSLLDTLENKSVLSNFKNDETTLDGDLLMLDTTLTISNDNTLMAHDQTCLDTTQTLLYNEVACQTTEWVKISDLDVNADMKVLSEDYKRVCQNLHLLKQENHNLLEQIDKYSKSIVTKKDTQTSPVKIDTSICHTCTKYRNEISEILNMQQQQKETIQMLSQELFDVQIEKEKYKSLTLEIPSTDSLICKLSTIEKERDSEVTKLMETITKYRGEIKLLQDENDTLSTQVMENITEADDLNNKLQILKESYATVVNKCTELQGIIEENEMKMKNAACPQCAAKDQLTRSLGLASIVSTAQPHSKLNRSMSESDTSSRFNKICTLQNELHAGKEDCKELTEDVTTIKNHLERSNLSLSQNMDLDDSIVQTNIFTFAKDFEIDPPSNKVMYDIPEEKVNDIYRLDKNDCINYYVEVTGADQEMVDYNMKLIDVMKMFYNNVVAKYNANSEILINKLKEYEEAKNDTENLHLEYKKIVDKMKEKNKQFEEMSNILVLVKSSVNCIMENISKLTESDKSTKIKLSFKENFLNVLDSNFGFTSANVFEHLIDTIMNRYELQLRDVINQNNKIQENMESVMSKLDIAQKNLLHMKSQLTDRENECNLLKAQKDRVHEISNAVTLDIIKREQEFSEAVTKGYQKLVDHNAISRSDIDWSLPINKNMNLLVERFISELENLKKESKDENFAQEIMEIKATLELKDKILVKLKEHNEKLSQDLIEKDNILQHQKSAYNELNTIYEAKVKDNEGNVKLVTNMSKDIIILKEEITNKQATIESLQSEAKAFKQNRIEKDYKIAELINRIASLKKEINGLKSINNMLMKEKESCDLNLAKSMEIIKQNKSEMENMSSDILVLRESVKDNMSITETLKAEAKSLLQQNLELKKQFEEKSKDCCRLEMNIKTHEKTAEIQSKMIIRLQNQKEEDDKVVDENNKRFEQLIRERDMLHKENEHVKGDLKSSKDEIDVLKNRKESLELRISELETELRGYRRRSSVEPNIDASRVRRQSMHDSQRAFSDPKQESRDQVEAAVQCRTKSNDKLSEADDDSSSRSTPLRISKGRDSLLSRWDQDEEVPSRPQSVQATRRRRQSSHDLHRSVSRTTPDPHDLPRRLLDDLNKMEPDDTAGARDPELMKLELLACKQELEELRERYKELDEECETCAQYLRERDEKCLRLQKEKGTLENTVAELREKLRAINPDKKHQQAKQIFTDASVHTDKDLSRRLLDNLNKMETDATPDTRDLESTKIELLACKQKLEELRQRYKELDEECETCAQYLREKEAKCLRLQKEKGTLENTVAELREKLRSIKSDKKQTKRIFADASVNTDEDWANLHSVVVDRMSYDAEVEKRKRLTKTIEELRFKNQDLRTTLAKMQTALDKKNTGKDSKEFEATKKELQACKVELEELRERYKELDDECETCAEYLRQRDEQCRKLKEAKSALEAKLQEFQADHSPVAQSARRRRQTLHDQNRGSVGHADVNDATTETSDDFLSYQVERDDGKQTDDKSREMKVLRMTVDKLTQQKAALEQKLLTMSATHPMYIATGSAIVQSQQLSDVMKENHKLKKINAKLVTICKKRGKDTNRENEDPSEQLG